MNFIKNIIRSSRQKILHLMLIVLAKKSIITNKRTLIIAPHPDDETFGCGGLITQKIRNGSDVFILFLTNGESSLQTFPQELIMENRRQSAIKAVKVIGVSEKNVFWMDLPDGSIPRLGGNDFNALRDNLLQMIESLGIQEVYTTHYLDGWSDHIAAYELAIEALKKSGQNIDLYLYWVWAWYYLGIKLILSLPWNKIFLLPVESVFDTKQKALQVYYDAKTPTKEPYMGNLPRMFLKAFDWPYEVYEKVEYK
ncbi:MAG: PIG-L deacetylase family protein [Sulfuricurvum sp.]|nr:PIG-L deacetylase family protein [Sulfuricurvum sp.]